MLAETPKPKIETRIIIIRETVRQSLISDATTWVMVVSIIGVGWFLGSSAMQWCGFLMLCVQILAKAANTPRLTIAEAREKLDEIEKENDAQERNSR